MLYARQQNWQDMTSDQHYLYILEADTQQDADAVVYAFGEIDPTASTQAAVIRRLPLDLPEAGSGYDGMALFSDQSQLYLLAGMPDLGVALYSIETPMTEEHNVLTLLNENFADGVPFAAEVSPGQDQLAVLTSAGIAVFDRTGAESQWQDGMGVPQQIKNDLLSDARTLVWISDSELLVGTAAGKLLRIAVP